MKIKKILAALAASAMAVTMMGVTSYAAGEEAEEDVIVDDEEIVEDEEIADDEEIVEDEVVAEPEVVETPVANNPQTGNSPIALAVIPVALAAAAVVAKKAK